MVRTLIVRGAVAVATALGLAALASGPASATATSLVLPQGAAFSILGHSCGGIQEKAYATGFDAASGYPMGDVYLSTSCGGSGRGGGYHTTTYSAWAAVTWDYTATVVSFGALSGAPSVNPTFSAFDQYGNQVYNQSNSAYLVVASGFVPVARVTGVSPSSGPAAGGTTVTITGAGFTGATAVKFGGVAATFTVSSSTSIAATSPAASAGTVDVTVTNAGGTSATSAGDQFTFVAAPTVSTVSPNTGPVAGGTSVTITGASFTGASTVAFGGTPTGFTVNSDRSITATSPAAESTDTVDITVTNVGGRSARTSADRFTYTALRPTVTGISPNVGAVDGGALVTITGANLSGATRVSFGAVAAQFGVDSDSELVAVSPPGVVGAVDVTVRTAGGTSLVNAGDKFTYVPDPSIASVNPDTGPVAGGTLVTITGANFTGATEVDFGWYAADFVVNSDSSITAVSPPGSPGTFDVMVFAGGGMSAATVADEFTYADEPPSVTGIAPGAGPVDGGTSVTITGTGLSNAVEVDFGGVPASFVVNDDTSITAVSPAASAGTVDVTVTTDGGTSATSSGDQFTYG